MEKVEISFTTVFARARAKVSIQILNKPHLQFFVIKSHRPVKFVRFLSGMSRIKSHNFYTRFFSPVFRAGNQSLADALPSVLGRNCQAKYVYHRFKVKQFVLFRVDKAFDRAFDFCDKDRFAVFVNIFQAV